MSGTHPAEVIELRARLEAAEETLRAIRSGEAVEVDGPNGPEIFSLKSAQTTFSRMRAEILDRITDAVGAHDKDGRLTYINAAAERLYRVTASEVLGRKLSTVFQRRWLNPEDEAVAMAAVDEHGHARCELIHVTRDGRELHVEASWTLLRDADGAYAGMVSVIRDISERKEVEEQLRRNHETFSRLIKDNPFGVYVIDADFVLREVSFGAQKVFSNVRPLLGRDFAEVLRVVWSEPFASEAIGRFRHTLSSGEPFVSPNTTELRHDIAQVEAYDWRIERIAMPDGRFGVVCYFYDLSERQRWEDALRQSEERFRALVTASSDVVYRMTPDWSAVRPLDGRGIVASTDTETRTWLHDYIHPEEQPRVMARISEAIRTRSIYEMEHRVRRVDGTWGWMFSRAVPILDAQGGILEWFGAASDLTTRKETEEALRLSEEKYRLLFDTLQEGIWAIDETAHTTFVNPRMAHMLGFSIAEMQGRHLFSFMDERGVEIAKRNLERRQHGIAEQHDFEFRHKDGQRVWVTMETSPLTDRDGHYIGALAGVMDITKRKEAEAALREKEALLHAADSRLAEILHGMTEACYSLDAEGLFTFVNDRLETLVRRPREELIGQSIFEIFPQLIGTPMEVDYRRAMKERIPLSWEILSPVLHRWLEIRVFPSGKGLAFFLHDIHERRLAEEALRASEERLRLITDLVPAGIFAKDATGRLIFANRAVAGFYGLSPEEILGKNDFELVADKTQADAYRADDLATIASGAARTIASEPNTNAAGRTRFLQTTKIPFPVPETGELGVLGVWVDITAKKHAEAQILQLNEELEARVVERTADLQAAVFALESEILARRRLEQEILEVGEREQSRLGQDLHDDLGQQLAGIGVLAHLLGTQLAAEAHPKAAQSAQLSVYCKQALTTARNLAKSFYPVELELHGLNIALEDLANRTAALGNLRCETRFDNGFRAEREAAIHLYRIVQESISNAIKHAQARCIVIEGSFRDGSMTLSVSDDGVGFEAPEQSRHAGMGLHIFQYRARLIGAKVEVQRISESGGCRVSCVWGRKRMGDAGTALS